MIQQQDENGKQQMPATTLTAVAVDRDKSSQQAVKWTVDHLLVGNHTMILVHVKSKTVINNGFSIAETTPMASKEQLENEMSHLFLPFRGLCARKGVQLMEVVLEDSDIARAIVDYITANQIHNIVVGASNRSALSKKFRNMDVATTVSKTAPEFCAVYVISKGKPQSVRSSRGPPPAANGAAAPPKQLPIIASSTIVNQDPDGSVKGPLARTNNRGGMLPPPSPSHAAGERRSLERIDNMRPPLRERPLVPGTRIAPGTPLIDGIIVSDSSHHRPTRRSWSHDSSDELDFPTSASIQALDFGDTPEYLSATPPSSSEPESPKESLSPTSSSSSQRDMEAEMRRLKLELKQTMDMYSTACKEAISAKQKAKELQQWKMEEVRKIEEARINEEAALRMAEMEKARCKAALEAAEAARRIAELEAHKRKNAELKAKRESEEKLKALDTLVRNDVQYRKYSIDDIEIATNYFSDSLKIGEGGYGPVYRASLDHTPVAIKVLRPDAAQGRKQFLQEVEVLSRIRHPNMVLLLGACPEYGCLVYEYMDNGSLEDRLFRRGNTPPIPWSVRFKIAAEIATGVLFLHQAKPEPLVHRDLKPANILLDRNYVSKISDVGLARLVPPSVAENVTQYRMTSTAGTFCYIDPEYQQTGMLGVKSDVYSLGILLLQIITAKSPMGLTHHVDRAIERGTFKEMLDSSVKDWPVEEALAFAKIALKCAELKRRDRPDLATVVLPELNRLRNLSHAYEEGLAVSGGFGGAAAVSSGVSLSRSSNSYSNGSGGHQRARFDQETASSPNLGTPWRNSQDVMKS